MVWIKNRNPEELAPRSQGKDGSPRDPAGDADAEMTVSMGEDTQSNASPPGVSGIGDIADDAPEATELVGDSLAEELLDVDSEATRVSDQRPGAAPPPPAQPLAETRALPPAGTVVVRRGQEGLMGGAPALPRPLSQPTRAVDPMPATAPYSPTASGGAATEDDVFVILPDQVDSQSIPVVDTQSLDNELTEAIVDDELAELAGQNEPLTESVDGALDVTESVEDALSARAAGALPGSGDAAGDDDLDKLISGLDDDAAGDGFAVRSSAGSGSSQIIRWGIGIAAVLGISAIVYFSYFGGGSGPRTAIAAGRSGVAVVPQAGSSTEAVSDVESVSPQDAGIGSADELKQSFRSKVQLALRVGFGGEETYE